MYIPVILLIFSSCLHCTHTFTEDKWDLRFNIIMQHTHHLDILIYFNIKYFWQVFLPSICLELTWIFWQRYIWIKFIDASLDMRPILIGHYKKIDNLIYHHVELVRICWVWKIEDVILKIHLMYFNIVGTSRIDLM